MFLFVAFLIFSGALAGAGYYVWSVPKQEEHEILCHPLARIARCPAALANPRDPTGPICCRPRTARAGCFAARSDRFFVAWIGPVRRLQTYIDQANLKYRAPEVLGAHA